MALVVDSLAVGGGERHTISLFNHLNPKKFELGLIYLKKNESLLSEVDRSRGPVWCADFGRGWDRKGLIRLSKWLNEYKPRVLVAVNAYPLFYSFIASRLISPKPLIAEIYHTGTCYFKEAIKMHLIYRWFFNASDQIIYVSDFQKRFWMARGFFGRKNIRIYNGIDTLHFTDRMTSEEKNELRTKLNLNNRNIDILAGFCATMRPEKCHLKILKAQKIAKDQGMPFKLLMIGDGPMRPHVERAINDWGLTNDVRITGFVLDVRPYLSICDCLIVNSERVENLSLSVLEAMSMGKPVIASDIGAIREQIQHGSEGYIFKTGSTDELLQCLSKIRNENTREKLGKNAKEKIFRMFDLKRMINEYEKTFCNMVGA
ncbi:MAG: glycosyltransferase family 4 protein [Desulfobacterales bacterium]